MRPFVHHVNCRCHASVCGYRARTVIRNPQSVIRNSQSGFTLIELLLVLVILATLAAIVTPKFAKRSEQAKITAAKTQISNFELALDAYEIEMGQYPTASEGLRALIERPASNSDAWQGPYLKTSEVPADPWDSDYVYRCPGEHNPESYDLYSYGPNQALGGDDDIGNWSTTKSGR